MIAPIAYRSELPVFGRRSERDHGDRRRTDRVQTQLLPHILRAKQHQLKQQDRYRGHRGNTAENGQPGLAVVVLEDERDHREHGEQEARNGELGDLVETELRER